VSHPRVIQKLKIQNGWEGKGNHRRACFTPSRLQHRPRSQRFPFVLQFKQHLAGQKFHEDEEVKNEVATWLRAKAADIHDVGIQELVTTLNKYLDKSCDYVQK
jgi:hypothetical protein